MEIKKLLACAAIALGCGSVWAQTDVTSTYLDNAGFDKGGFITAGVCTYAKDVAGNGADGSSLMAVPSWTAGDTGDAKAGAAFEFGSNAFLTGTGFRVPATNSEGNAEGGALGLGGCWDGNAYYTQDLKQSLSAGTYTIEICAYNAGTATAFGTQTFGIKEANGTTRYVTTTWTSGKWTKATLNFEISKETAGTFYLGATKVGGGSASSAKLFIDYVKIYKAKSLQDLMDEATEASPADVTSFYLQNAAVTGTDGWTNGRVNSNEQYDGAPDNTYLDAWNANFNMNQKVTLKPGKYTLKAATRAVSTISVANIYANVAGGSNNSTDITAVGNTDGELGRGWGWTTVDFLVMEEAEVTIGFYSECGGGKWAGADNFTLLYDRKIQDSDKLPAAKDALKAAIDKAPEIALSAIGNKAFMYPSETANDYNIVLSNAKEVLNNESATLSMVEAATKAVKELTLPALNAPSPDQAYKIILKYDGWNYDNCAITSSDNRDNQGGYNLSYLPQNANYAQAMFFTAVEGGYNISFTDAAGETRYICTGVPYGGNTAQIRTTTTEDDALVIDVRRNGDVIQLWNTDAKQFIGSQDAGVFTVNSHINFVVAETTAENKILVNIPTVKEGLGYVTVCVPYNAHTYNPLYAVNEVDEEGTLNLELISSGDLEANKAYIIGGAGQISFSGVNVAYAEPTANGLLTGVYTETAAPVGSYVLQTQNGAQAFFKVAEGKQPKLAPNKAYLTAPEATEAKLNIANATAIKAIDALVNGSAKIYDINGRQINKLQKGVNIVNGVKVMVK